MLKTCPDCGRYSLEDRCPACGLDTHDPAPAKFSPDEKHGEYRRRLKRLDEQDTGDDRSQA